MTAAVEAAPTAPFTARLFRTRPRHRVRVRRLDRGSPLVSVFRVRVMFVGVFSFWSVLFGCSVIYLFIYFFGLQLGGVRAPLQFRQRSAAFRLIYEHTCDPIGFWPTPVKYPTSKHLAVTD